MKQIDWKNEREKAKRQGKIGILLFVLMMIFLFFIFIFLYKVWMYPVLW